MKEAFLQFGGAVFGGVSMLTQSVPLKESPLAWQLAGYSYTATGYGRKIPTRYMVQWEGRWRRVYCCVLSNNGTLYLAKGSEWLCTVDLYDDGKES